MNLRHISDHDLLAFTQTLVQTERETVTKVIHSLREIERRRLYSDLGYSSLFDYAVKHLKYSEGQAGRKIQAMKLLNELPELEKKLESGVLNLTNVAKAQSVFREVAGEMKSPLSKAEKLDVMNKLENKSSREGEKELLKILPKAALPKEKERQLTEEASEVRFVMNSELKTELEKVRSLLGPKGVSMSFAELIAYMTKLTANALEAKKFGKKRVESEEAPTPAQDIASRERVDSTTQEKGASDPRYISKSLHHAIWKRDNGACVQCKTTKNLQLDHIIPISYGGESKMENLRLLCFSCNQRAGMKVFGVEFMHLKSGRGS